MTPSQHAQRIRQIAFKLEKADFGLGMPRDYNEVLRLRTMLNDAIKDYANDLVEYPSSEELQEARADLYGRAS